MALFLCPFCRAPVVSVLDGCLDALDAECGICFSDDKPRMLLLRACGHAACYACCERMESPTRVEQRFLAWGEVDEARYKTQNAEMAARDAQRRARMLAAIVGKPVGWAEADAHRYLVAAADAADAAEVAEVAAIETEMVPRVRETRWGAEKAVFWTEAAAMSTVLMEDAAEMERVVADQDGAYVVWLEQ